MRRASFVACIRKEKLHPLSCNDIRVKKPFGNEDSATWVPLCQVLHPAQFAQLRRVFLPTKYLLKVLHPRQRQALREKLFYELTARLPAMRPF
jgi:hypothetical protein